MHRRLSAAFFLLALTAISSAQIPPPFQPRWAEVAPGVWKTTLGTPEELTLLSAAGRPAPLKTALAAMSPAPFPFDHAEIEGRLIRRFIEPSRPQMPAAHACTSMSSRPARVVTLLVTGMSCPPSG